jgi:catalase
MANTVKNTIKGRKVAMLAAEGFDAAQLTAMKTAVQKAGAVPELIGPHLGPLKSADGQEVMVDKSLLTVASVMYDAVYVPGGQASVAALRQAGDAIHFVNEAFKHCKAIAATGEGMDLLLASDVAGRPHDGQQPESELQNVAGIVVARDAKDLKGLAKQFIDAIAQHRFFTRQMKERVPA